MMMLTALHNMRKKFSTQNNVILLMMKTSSLENIKQKEKIKKTQAGH